MPEHLFVRFGEEGTGYPEASIMLGLIRNFDWAQSPAGPIETWPDELKSAVRLILLSGTAMAVLIGRDGIMVQNDALLDMLGDDHGHTLGQSFDRALPEMAGFIRDAVEQSYKGKGVRFHDQPVKLLRKGVVETAWFSVSFTPIVDMQAAIYGVLVAVSETTERMRALKALERSRQRMELALEAGGIIGTWDLDIRDKRVTASGALAGLFGPSDDSTPHEISNARLLTSLHPQDRRRVLRELRAAIKTGADYRCRYRVMTAEGDMRWLVASGRPLRDEKGRVVQFAGIVIDITEQTETAAALEQSNLRLDILAESIPQIIWSTDAEGRHDYFNQRWTEFTGIPPEKNKPTTWQELVHPDDWPRVAATWQECLASGNAYDIDYRFRYRDGTYRWLWVLSLPLRDAEGRIIRWYGTSSDIDASRQLEEQRSLVAHELDHRIKNLFALVNGLVGLSVREQPEHRPLAETLYARLDALNRAHGLIRGGSEGRKGSLRNLLQQLLAPYVDGSADRIIIDGPDVAVDAGAVTSIALVFHELITNAAKYGALSHADGALHITLQSQGDNQIIDWREQFQERVEGKPSEGFGSRLLKTMVERHLRGSLNREISSTGLATRLVIPHVALSNRTGIISRE